MKKLVLIFILFIFLLSGCKGCKNASKTMSNGFDITVNEELKKYFIHQDDIPILHFDMKDVNVSLSSSNANYVLVNNDFNLVSDAWAKHLQIYDDNQIIITQEIEQTNDKSSAKFGDSKLPLDEVDENGNPQKYSKEYQIVAWTNTGTRYSYQYRTFVSNNKRYYVYCYTAGLSLCLEQSLMVIRKDKQNKLLLVPLPYDTKYEVSGSSLTVESLIDKDTYLDVKFRRYIYPSFLNNSSLDDKISNVKKWYQVYCNGRMENDHFIIDYAGAQFEVIFNVKKQDVSTNKELDAFELKYIS